MQKNTFLNEIPQYNALKFSRSNIDEAFQILSGTAEGLSNAEVKNRLQQYGYNSVKASKPFAIWVLIGKQLQNMFTIILIIAGIISLIFHAFTDASIILLIVTLNIFIGFMQEFKAEKALKELQKFIAKTTIV
ncbi:MAG: hypothetical protein KKF78_08280, partial [Candidatus Omnitrophica bacterium]|nr:hypothetical protein [Candidatus Omnitrophota bacterium]